jgi:excinuclease UvrABC ATPase subunit
LATNNVKSALKLKTYSESLLVNYGESGVGKKSLKFKDIIIREYERTLGDNPSCSSGPPMS